MNSQTDENLIVQTGGKRDSIPGREQYERLPLAIKFGLSFERWKWLPDEEKASLQKDLCTPAPEADYWKESSMAEYEIIPAHDTELKDIKLAMEVAESLNKYYPGHLWAVNAQNDQGVVDIKCLNISGKYGMRILLREYHKLSPELQKKHVIQMGGEFLERAHLLRGANQFEGPKILEGAKDRDQPKNGIII